MKRYINTALMYAVLAMIGGVFYREFTKCNRFNAKTRRVLLAYHIGLNLTAAMFVVRGVTQVLVPTLSYGMDAAISGVAGIGHILLGVSMLLLLVQIRRSVSVAQT